MKVLIMTLGTRGDVQPFIALARGLLAAGHEAVLAAPQRFAGFAAGHGVPFAGVDDGPMRLMDDPAVAGAHSDVSSASASTLRMPRGRPALTQATYRTAAMIKAAARLIIGRPRDRLATRVKATTAAPAKFMTR